MTNLTISKTQSLLDSVVRDTKNPIKVEFFFLSGHTYTANHVLYIENDNDTLYYVSFTKKDDVVSFQVHAVDKSDLSYAVIYDSFKGENTTTIIHNVVNKFSIEPSDSEKKKLHDSAHELALKEERFKNWNEKEHKKYVERKRKRAIEDGVYKN